MSVRTWGVERSEKRRRRTRTRGEQESDERAREKKKTREPEFHLHKKEDIHATSDEEYLHDEIVQRDPTVYEVEVTRDEDCCI